MAESAPRDPGARLGAGTCAAGADHNAQAVRRPTRSMNRNQRRNTKYSQGRNALRDCRDNCNTLFTQCFNIANTIHH